MYGGDDICDCVCVCVFASLLDSFKPVPKITERGGPLYMTSIIVL